MSGAANTHCNCWTIFWNLLAETGRGNRIGSSILHELDNGELDIIDGQHVLPQFCCSSKPWDIQTLIPSDWSLCTKNLLSISERITAPLPHGSNIRTVTGYYTGKSVRVPNNLCDGSLFCRMNSSIIVGGNENRIEGLLRH